MENIIINDQLGFKQLKPVEGYLITSYKDTDDIENYYSTTEVDAPLTADISIYKAITLELDAVYKKQKEEKLLKLSEEYYSKIKPK